MSISSALSNAVSGLTLSARRAEVTSNNIANALTEGYARREVESAEMVVDGAGAGDIEQSAALGVGHQLVDRCHLGEASVVGLAAEVPSAGLPRHGHAPAALRRSSTRSVDSHGTSSRPKWPYEEVGV